MIMKVIVCGPKSSGKTSISNYLSGQTDKLGVERYNPTVGVRILEFELQLHGVSEQVNIELWDASGDSKYEGCWRAIMHDADGVILGNRDVAIF